MKLIEHPRWAAVALSMMAGISLPACRFGNYVILGDSADQVSGYYETEPEFLMFCAALNTTNCIEAETQLIPSMLSGTITNPLRLVLQDLDTGLAVLAPPYQSKYLVVLVTPNSELLYLDSKSSETLWRDPTCSTRQSLETQGKILRGAASTTGTDLPVIGRLELSFQVVRLFEGNCSVSLREMAQCYDSVSLCGGTSPAQNDAWQARARDLIGAYIQSGVLSTSALKDPSLNSASLGYEISYR